jgi:hypothetical protein
MQHEGWLASCTRVNAPSPGRRGPSMEATKNKAERMNMLTAFVQQMDPSAPLSSYCPYDRSPSPVYGQVLTQ